MRNNELLNSELNTTFDQILEMSEKEFRQWCNDLRKLVVFLWDTKDLPPNVGSSEEDIIEDFKKMLNYPVHEFLQRDLLTGDNNLLRNTSYIGSTVSSWFPTMMKTKITYTTVDKAKSIYDFFADPNLFDRFYTYAHRHFKRDSFYHYSNPVKLNEPFTFQISEKRKLVYSPESGENLINWMKKQDLPNWSYWLEFKEKEKEYTGYNQELKGQEWAYANDELGRRCRIRVYEKGQRLFPKGLKAFRVSFCQYAVNFPPLTAKYLYEKYLPNDNSNIYKIYDPSMGWAGRLLGALSIDTRRSVMYIGTDPNTDHNTIEGKTKYHQVAEFFNQKVRKSSLFGRKQQYEIYQLGSEVIRNDPKFQEHKGKIDLVFTSPPYFAKEVYSQDTTQSCNKFGEYQAWRDGFLKPTLETCVEWLKHDRYLLWNISDAVFAGEMLPLEKDSRDILESLGMKYIETLKMALAQMPGGNRFVDSEETEEIVTNTIFGTEVKTQPKAMGMMKNYCKINSKGKEILLKFEPIMVFKKG